MQPLRRPALYLVKQVTAASQNGIARGSSPALRRQQWTCAECHSRIGREVRRTPTNDLVSRRWLHTTRKHSQESRSSSNVQSATAQSHIDFPNNAATPLPSDTASKRWEMSERMTKMVDGILARASTASQHINAYTGTDYSGIDALRKEIMGQESKVREYHGTVEQAKKAHEEELSKQGSSQKEIVSLLERKSQWTPSDLERYMALVRTEHVYEQALQSAKNKLDAAERDLEASRGLLEKLERKQYHEEQIWSDTIRRNSTWVTFGLMGVNIILLLAQILIFEPYRRKKIVRDMKAALDEKTINATILPIERQIDAVVPPPTPLEQLEQPEPVISLQSPEVALPARPLPNPSSEQLLPPLGKSTKWEAYQAALVDLFSDRLIQLKQVDITTIALQSAASGAAMVGLLLVLLRPR